jgi:hypothetical protein
MLRFAVVATVVAGGAMNALAAGGVQFVKDYQQAMSAAARSGLPVMVEITGPG